MLKSRASSPTPTRFRWWVFAMACSASWLTYFQRYIFALIKPELVAQWGLTKPQLGMLDSIFATTYSVFQVPLGVAADLFGVHLVLTLLLVLGSLGLGMVAWAPSPRFPLRLAQAVMGIGHSAIFAALNRMTRSWFPASVRTTVQGWVGIFFARLGGVSSNLLIGALLIGVFHLPWRTTVFLTMGFGLLLAALFGVFFRNTPEEHPAVNAAEVETIEGRAAGSAAPEAPPRLKMREAFRRMSPRSIANLLTLNLQTILSNLADTIYSSWLPLFLFEVHGLQFREMGIYSALPLLGGAAGGAVGGWLNDALIRRTGNRRWSRRVVGLAGKGVAAVLLIAALLLWYREPRHFCAMLFFVKFFSDWSLTTTWGAVTDFGGRASATVFAFNNAMSGIGAIAGPIFFGSVAQHWGWPLVFVSGATAYLLCASTWLLIDCEIPLVTETRAADPV